MAISCNFFARGLHNRITKRIDLLPFNLYETELYLKSNGIEFDRYQIIQLYMARAASPII